VLNARHLTFNEQIQAYLLTLVNLYFRLRVLKFPPKNLKINLFKLLDQDQVMFGISPYPQFLFSMLKS
jgi:hypothetical protein